MPFKKGHIVGKRFTKGQTSAFKGKKHTSESNEKNRLSHLGKTPWNKGKHGLQKSTRKGKPSINMSGKNHWNWKGGISSLHEKIRGSLEYKFWEDSVLNNDGNRCVLCKESSVRYLVAHHILNFAQYPELRFTINNGVTFCRDCHKVFHKRYGFKNNTRAQVDEFLML